MKQFDMVELSFKGAKLEGSWAIIDLQATITNGEDTKTVKGFYDGDGVYKLRFMPEKTGTYTYKVSGCITAEGSVEVSPADGNSHGIVRADGTRFVYADGSAYHPFGTTVYALLHQPQALIDQTIDTLSKAPFNKIRLCTFPKFYDFNYNEPDHYAFEKDAHGNWDVHRPNMKYWAELERRMGQLKDLGIEVDLILFHPYDKWGFSTMSLEQDLVYLDYLLRRMSAMPNVWWSLANEYDLTRKGYEHWYAIENFIASNDPYHHLLSNHNCLKTWDFSRENITHACIQTGQLHRTNWWLRQYGKPVMIDECCYEGNVPHGWGSISPQEMTSRFWKVTALGAYCTHGETYLDDNDVLWWAKGGVLKGESPKRIAFLREIIESLPGHLECDQPFLEKISQMSEAERAKMDLSDPSFRDFVEGFWRLGEDMAYFAEIEVPNYYGHIGDDYFLRYYDRRTCVKDFVDLPKDKTYTVEVIDTWGMTRTTIATKASGRFELKLPGKEFTAVLISKE